MNVNDAQQEMRSAFLGGFAGQLVSGFIWLAALLVVGGALLAAYGPSIFSLGGWLTAVALIIYNKTQSQLSKNPRFRRGCGLASAGHSAPESV
jgi:predicted lipid-binding transport protein (Tim44 family)